MCAPSSVGKGVFHFPGEIDADLILVTVTYTAGSNYSVFLPGVHS